MEAKHKLDVETLAVDSFAAGKTQQAPKEPQEHVNVLTCLQTNCPPYFCCA